MGPGGVSPPALRLRLRVTNLPLSWTPGVPLRKVRDNVLCSVVQMKNPPWEWQCPDLRLAFHYEISKHFSTLLGCCLKKMAESSCTHRHSEVGMCEARFLSHFWSTSQLCSTHQNSDCLPSLPRMKSFINKPKLCFQSPGLSKLLVWGL